ncbi:hypothetical protein F5X97DRAFT_329129 [Nemania serpens]|nr:hypothetical protein F5X97DRAFT_329129 [Nemania serpens]
MDEDTPFGLNLSRLDEKLEEVIRERRQATPEIPLDGDFENPPRLMYDQLAWHLELADLQSDLQNIKAPDVLLTELSFQSKQLLGALPSADPNSVDISLLQEAVKTLWNLLNALGLDYRPLRRNITGEPEEKVLKFYRTHLESLTLRKWNRDLVQAEKQLREEYERYYESITFLPGRKLMAGTPASPTRTPSPTRQTRIPSPTRQTRIRRINRKGSPQPQRQSQPPPRQPAPQTPERRVLRPRGPAPNALAPSKDGGVKKPSKDGGVKKPSKDGGVKKPSKDGGVKKPSTEPRYRLRSYTRNLQ